MQHILIIGGTRFMGPYLVERLLARGHDLVLFTRGGSPVPFTDKVRFIRKDRNDGFGLKDRFDTVIDMCAYNGLQTERALRDLQFDFFVHLSTAAVYKKTEIFPLTEDSPLGEWPLWGDYNRGKVECERVLQESNVKRAIIRPVYILGPKNYLNRERFIYSKIKNREPIIIPGNGQALIQFVSVKEVAEAITLLVEKKMEGAFNVAGDEITTPKGLVEEMAKIIGEEPRIEYNLHTDGEKFNIKEFPFANENIVASNQKIKNLGITFTSLPERLKDDYESFYILGQNTAAVRPRMNGRPEVLPKAGRRENI